MNIFTIIRSIYEEQFTFIYKKEFDLDKTFNPLNDFHEKSMVDSENQMEVLYAKIFKNNIFYMAMPIVYMYLRFLAIKYTHPEYLEGLVNKHINNEEN